MRTDSEPSADDGDDADKRHPVRFNHRSIFLRDRRRGQSWSTCLRVEASDVEEDEEQTEIVFRPDRGVMRDADPTVLSDQEGNDPLGEKIVDAAFDDLIDLEETRRKLEEGDEDEEG